MPGVKNLRGTASCSHIGPYRAFADAGEKCAANGCGKRGNRACHVIAANQSAASGHRVLVYMCASCNATYDQVLEVRANAHRVDLTNKHNCKCGHD